MSNVKVCVRFRPLNSRERKISGNEICFRQLDAESFVFKDEKGDDAAFSFDRVFYQDSEQKDLNEFIAKPIVEDSMNAINGTILTYGQSFPAEAPPLISGVIQKLIVLCLSGEDDQNPSRTSVRTFSGAILARLLVMNTDFLARLASDPSIAHALQQAGLSINQNVLLCLVDLWIDKIDNATSMQKKAYALALSIILTLRVPEVIDKLEDILSVCTTVLLGESKETGEDDSSTSSPWSSNETIGFDGVPSKELRRRQIKDSDPIKQLSLENMLRENLNTCASFHGEATFNSAISRIHPSALSQIKQALKMA